MKKRVLLSLIIIIAIALFSINVFGICGGNYTGPGDWNINSTIICDSAEIINVFGGSIIVADDSVGGATQFGAPGSAYDLTANEVSLDLSTPDLNVGTPSEYTSDWDGSPDHDFLIAMNQANHRIQFFLENRVNSSMLYMVDIDNNVSSGCTGPIACPPGGVGADIAFGYAQPINSIRFTYWNESLNDWSFLSDGMSVTTGADANLTVNFSVYFAFSPDPVAIEAVINVTGPWIDKPIFNTDLGPGQLFTTFQNTSIPVTPALGNLTLSGNTNLFIEGDLVVNQNAYLTTSDAFITFNLTKNASSNFTINSGTFVNLDKLTITSNQTDLYWGLGVSANDVNITSSSISYNGVDSAGPGVPALDNSFVNLISGKIFNNTFSNCNNGESNVAGCLYFSGTSNINVTGNTFLDTDTSGIASCCGSVSSVIENNTFNNQESSFGLTQYINNSFGQNFVDQSSGCLLKNNRFQALIVDTNETVLANNIHYTTDFGEILWVALINSTIQVGEVHNFIYIENNTVGVGVEDDIGLNNLNTTAQLTFYGLGYASQPELHKDGVRCDNETTCNITSYAGGTLLANVSGFSNYTTTTSNSAPSVTMALIPAVAYTTNNLNATVNYADVDSDAGTVYFDWWVNGTPTASAAPSGVSAGTNVSDILTFGNYSRWANVTVQAVPNDGTTNGTAVNVSINISNSPPDVIESTLIPVIAYTNNTLNATMTLGDTDNDAGTIYFDWFVNDTWQYAEAVNSVEGDTNASVVLNPDNFTRWSNVTIQITPYDGTVNGTAINKSINITNLQAFVNSTTIYSPDNCPTTPINGTSMYNDEDIDSGTIYFEWFVDNTINFNEIITSQTPGINASRNLSADNFTIGNVVKLQTTVFDGIENGSATNSSSITIVSCAGDSGQSSGSGGSDIDVVEEVVEEVIDDEVEEDNLDTLLASWEQQAGTDDDEDEVEEVEEEQVQILEEPMIVESGDLLETEADGNLIGSAINALFKTKRNKGYAGIVVIVAVLGVLLYFIKKQEGKEEY